MRVFNRFVFLILLCAIDFATFASPSSTAQMIKPIDFSLIKMQGEAKDEIGRAPTLLLIGGIQGDEPGGFNATNVFLNHYKITKGGVWVIPVINPHSMLQNHRGLYDDMNRKFATLSPKDPEAPLINRVKSIIDDSNVDVILHLHDGSGFFRHTHQSELLSPKRWGNCTIIDQDRLEGVRFGELNEIATHITKRINTKILKPLHEYRVRNTKTQKEDKEMQKALTFYAIKGGKAAFANEASKTLNVKERVYYHLLAIEALLERVGIGFERDFELSVEGVGKAIYDRNLRISIEGMPPFPLFDLRDEIRGLPLPAGKRFESIVLDSRAKILGLLPKGNSFILKYGNNGMTKIVPKYVEFAKPKSTQIMANVDNKRQNLSFGEVIKARESLEIDSAQWSEKGSYQVKVIGLKSSPKSSTITIKKENLNPLASIDKAGNLYRVEFYAQSSPSNATTHFDESLWQKVRYASLESPTMPKSQETKNFASKRAAQVIASSAFVRSEPSELSPSVAKAPKGRKLYVLSTQKALQSGQNASQIGGIWARVEYDFGGRKISGYILESLLGYGDFVVDSSLEIMHSKKDSLREATREVESTKESKSTQSKLESTKTPTSEGIKSAQVIASSAFVRSEPSELSPPVAKAPKGRKLYVLSTQKALQSGQNASQIGGIWARVEYDFGGRKISGYILESLLGYGDFALDSSLGSALSPKQSIPKEVFLGMILVDFSH